MMTSTRGLLCFIYVPLSLICFTRRLPAQSAQAAAGAIQGAVVNESGHYLRALVALRPVGASVRPGFTAVDGTFAFRNLPAGTYTLCARIPSEQAPSPKQPYLDTCTWEQPQTAIRLAAGQAVSGVQVRVPLGALLQVRVQDPGQILAAASALQAAQTLDRQVELIVRAPTQMGHRLSFVSSDPQGRNYALAVPAGTALSLSATSAQANLLDASGLPLQAPVSVASAVGSTLSPITITVHK